MANRAVLSTIDVTEKKDGSAIQVIWAGPGVNGDTFSAVSFPKHGDKSIQVAGVLGTGSIGLSGSNDGVNFSPLNTPASAAIALAAAGIKAVLENTVLVQPILTGGDGTTSITVSMLFHFSNPTRQ